MVAIVVGTAKGFEKELAEARKIAPKSAYIIGLNRAFRRVKVNAVYSFHEDFAVEATKEFFGPVICPSDDRRRGVLIAKDMGFGGSSALEAAIMAINFIGASKVIVCGVHLKFAYSHFRQAWIDTEPYLNDRCRGIDGFTVDLLGKATKYWIRRK